MFLRGCEWSMKRWYLDTNAVEIIMALQVECNLPIDLYIGRSIGSEVVEIGLEYEPAHEELAQWLIGQGNNTFADILVNSDTTPT